MARILLLILLLLPLARPALPETPADVRLQYIERDLDRLRQEIGTRPEMERLQRLEAEIAGVRAALKETEKAATDSVKEKLDAQDKRIGDLGLLLAQGANTIASSSNAISSASNTTSWVVGLVGAAITVSLLGFNLYTAFKVPQQARLEAKAEARAAIADHMRSSEGQGQVHEAVKAATGLTSAEFDYVKLLAKRGDSADSSQRTSLAPIPLPAGAENTIAKILEIPAHQRSSDEWRALILDRTEQKLFEAALALANLWLEQPSQTPANNFFALRTKGWVLLRSGRFAESIIVFDDALKRFGTDPAFGEQVARALVNKGYALGQLTPPQPEAAIAAYDDVIQRFGSDPAPALREEVARALVNKGYALGQLTPPQLEAAIAAYDDVIVRFGSDPAPALREEVANALFNKGVTLGQLTPPQPEAEIAAYDDVIRRFGSDPAPALREQVAMAFVNKGITLGQLTPPQWEAAIAAYTDVIQRFGSDPALALREEVARALVNKGYALRRLTPPQREAEIATYDDVIHRFGSDPAPALREMVAKALVNKGITLGQLTPPQPEAEIAAYNDVIQRFGSDPAPALREQVAKALHYKAITLNDLNRFADALAVCEDYIHRFADAPETAIQEMTTKVRSLLSNLPPPEPSADS